MKNLKKKNRNSGLLCRLNETNKKRSLVVELIFVSAKIYGNITSSYWVDPCYSIC